MCSLLKQLADAGLQRQLPADHELMTLYDSLVLQYTHPTQHEARKNYLKTISRTFRFVQDTLNRKGVKINHWVDLMTDAGIIIDYLDLYALVRFVYEYSSNTVFCYFQTSKARPVLYDLCIVY